MPRYTFIQNSFISGELSPRLYARTDINEYQNGVKELTNMIPFASGGAGLRPGFRQVNSISTAFSPASKDINIPFVFSKTETFRLEIKAADPLNGVVYDADDNVLQVLILGLPDSIGVHYVQINDIIVITHNSGTVPPQIIYRTFDSISGTNVFVTTNILSASLPSIAYSALDVSVDFRIPYQDASQSSTTITPSAATGTITLTASANLFQSDHVGAHFKLDENGTSPAEFMNVRVTSYTSPTSVQAVVLNKTSAYIATATDWWYESAWNDYNGYPKSVTVHENRLIFGGNIRFPNTVWASAQFNYFHFDRFVELEGGNTFTYAPTPTQLQAPYEFTIAGQQANPISWVAGGRNLIIGTLSQEYVVNGNGESLSRINFSLNNQTSVGSSPYQPAQSDSRVYFISRDGRSIHELGYSEENGSYVNRQVSLLSDEIIHKDQTDRSSRFIKVVWQQSRNTLWAITTNYNLYSITVNQAGSVTAWAKHPISDTNIYDIMVKPNSDGSFDDLYVIADNSNIPTANTAYTLKMVDDFLLDTLFDNTTREEDQPVYLDFSKFIDNGTPTTSFSIGAEFDGTNFTVLADNGNIYTGLTSSSGNITLPDSATKICVGFAYEGLIETLTPEVGPNKNLNSQGDIRRIDRATIFLYKSYTGQYGIGDTIYDIEEVSQTGEFTGKIQPDIPDSPDLESNIIIKSTEPLPMNILGIVLRGVNNI